MTANRPAVNSLYVYETPRSLRYSKNSIRGNPTPNELQLPDGATSITSRRKYRLSPVAPGYVPYGSRYTDPSDDERTDYDLDGDITSGNPRGWKTEKAPKRRQQNDFSPTQSRTHDDDMFRYLPPRKRFEPETRPDNRQSKFATKVVTFYRNGDKHFQGVQLPVNGKIFRTWESLLTVLNGKIPLPYGVRNIYTLTGDEVKNVVELVDGRAYVCASGQFNPRIPYGKVEFADKHWSNRRLSAGANRHTDRRLLTLKDGDGGEERKSRALASNIDADPSINKSTSILAIDPSVSHFAKPRVVTVISNTHRGSRAKILINPKTTQTFEQIMKDVTQSIVMSNPPVKQLFTWRTEEKVLSFTQLFRDFRDHDKFIACGLEPIKRTTHLQQRSVDEEVLPNQKLPPSTIRDDENERLVRIEQAGYYVQRFQDWKRRAKNQEDPVGTFVPNGYPFTVKKQGGGYAQNFRQHKDYHETSPPLLPPLKPRRAFGGSSSEESSPRDYDNDFRGGGGGGGGGGRRFVQSEQKPSRNNNFFKFGKKLSAPGAILAGVDRKGVHVINAAKPRRSKDVASAIEQIEEIIEDDLPQNIRVEKQRKGVEKNVDANKQKRKVLAPPAVAEVLGERKEFLAPTDAEIGSKNVYKPPQKKLKLEWVYGYHGFKDSNNLLTLSSGEYLYTVGAIAVLHDTELDQQRHYTGHNEDIQALAVHPAGNYVATGQVAGNMSQAVPPDVATCHSSHVRVWEVETLHTHAIIGLDFFEGGISCLAFSKENNGEWLMAVDRGIPHTVSVWDWNEDYVMVKSREYSLFDNPSQEESNTAVTVGAFHPYEDTILVTAGRKHIHFWRFNHNKLFRDKRSGVFDEERPEFVTCLEFSPTGDVLTGDSSGNISVWEKDHDSAFRLRYRIQRAHEKSVFALRMLEDGTLLSGGGIDRRLLAWDSLHGYVSAKVERLFPEYAGGIRTIALVNPGSADGQMLIGTTKNHIMEGSLQTKFVYVTQGHSEDLWAMDVHPEGPVFVTAGYDQNIFLWRTDSHKMIWKASAEKPCSCSVFHPSGNMIAIGTTVGRLIVLSSNDGMHIASVQVSREHINVVRFSPDGSYLAVGCQDCRIYIYTVMDEGQVYRKQGILQGHPENVTHIDWSDDGQYLQSVSTAYDLLFWSVDEMAQEGAASLRDVTWKTQTCILGYTVAGIWPTNDRFAKMQSVDRSRHSKLAISGDQNGQLSLYTYPCPSYKFQPNESKAQSSHIGTAKFIHDDSYVISAGGSDAVLMQWAIVDKNNLQSNHHIIDEEDEYGTLPEIFKQKGRKF